jgi:hypothetical protein
MSPLDVLTILVAVLVGGAVIYFFILPSAVVETNQPAQLFLDAPASVLPNQPVMLTIAASSAQGKIIRVLSNDDEHTFTCDTDPCIFSLALSFSAPGTQTISANVDSIILTKKVEVTTIVSRCIDGTTEGACSTSPLQCVNGQLQSNCDQCGCVDGKQCISGTCSAPPLTFSVSSFSAPASLYTNIPGNFSYTIQNTSLYPADGLFLLVISAYDSSKTFIAENAQQIQLDNLAPTNTFSNTLRAGFSASTSFVLLRLYAEPKNYPSSPLLAESTFLSVTVLTDTTPPSPPANVTTSSSGDATILTWSPSSSSDVDHYTIYQENFSSGGFTTYSIAGETTETFFQLDAQLTPLAYVLRAVDGAGNTSEPTQPIVIPAS